MIQMNPWINLNKNFNWHILQNNWHNQNGRTLVHDQKRHQVRLSFAQTEEASAVSNGPQLSMWRTIQVVQHESVSGVRGVGLEHLLSMLRQIGRFGLDRRSRVMGAHLGKGAQGR
jgi:hypothetical protein